MRTAVVGVAMLSMNAAVAGQADNILGCVEKARQFAGVSLNEFDASYVGNWLAPSEVRWPNAYCEAKVGAIYTLTVDGIDYIYRGYSGKASYELYELLDGRTDAAISQLESRIALLRDRLRTVDAELSTPKPDHPKLSRYVDEGIAQALGLKSDGAPGWTTEVTRTTADTANETSATAPPTDSEGIPATELEPTRRFVRVEASNVRLGPSLAAPITNKIYRQQAVEVLELRDGWARISPYYDGEVEGQTGQVARWVSAASLSSERPPDLSQPTIERDSRIAPDAFPKVGSDGMTEPALRTLHKGAKKYLDSGRCQRVEFGDRSVDKPNTYYINCGGPNIFFTAQDLE